MQLELLKEVDRLCKIHNIKYTITAGTLLGAVRHKGFIPWDDDADISMIRSEYEKFCRVCAEELEYTQYYFQNHKNTPGYRWGYAKFRRQNTLYLRENQDHLPYEQGISIDIFPLDGIPDNFILEKIHLFWCFFIRKILYSPVGMVEAKSSFLRSIYQLLYTAFDANVFIMYEKQIERCNKKRTKRVCVLTRPILTSAKKIGVMRELYEDLTPVRFENETLMAIKDADTYLKNKYGDYLKLPEVKDRKIHAAKKIQLYPSSN